MTHGKAFLAGAFLLIAGNAAVRANSITVLAKVDGYLNDKDNDGFFEEVDTSSASFGAGVGQRGAVEFDLSAIPRYAIINSVTFNGSIDVYVFDTIKPSINIGTYAGNGVIESADATASNTSIAILATQVPGTPFSITLPAFAIRNSFSASSYVGLNFWPATSEGAIGITSLENVNPYPKPSLTVNYSVPLPLALIPASLTLLCVGGIARLRRRCL